MYTSKFYTLLATLQDAEVAAFHKYLKHVHAKKDLALPLFEYFRKVYKRPDAEKKLEIAYAYRKIYDTEIGDNRKTTLNTVSDLYRWLKEFLLWEKVKSKSFESKILWLTVLKERGLKTEFSSQIESLRIEVESNPKKQALDYLKNLVVQHIAYFGNPEERQSLDDQDFRHYLDELEVYGTASKLKAACEMLNAKNLRPSDFVPSEWLDRMQKTALQIPENEPLLLLYQEVCQLIATQDDLIFKRIEKQISEQAENIAPNELNEILLYLINYGSLKVRKGDEAVWTRIHSLNRLGVKYNIFLNKGEMSGARFQNIVNAACKVKDFVWIKSFISTQSDNLESGVRPELVALANAMVAFEKKEFKSVVKALGKTPLRDIHIQIRTKSMLLISYFELGYDEAEMLSFCTNFELLLKRNRKPLAGAVQGTINFILIVKILIYKKMARQQVINQIEHTNMLYFRPWLLEKADNYKTK